MVESEILPNKVLVLRPSGPISTEDIAAVREKVDALLAGGERLAGLMIEADGFPGWKDFAAMTRHLGFVREHHREIPRVAVVSDSHFLAALPKLARHFLHAEFRHFPAGEAGAALAWIDSPAAAPPQAIRRGWFPDRDLVWIYVRGRVTTEEYKDLAEWMTGILAERSPVNFLIDLEDLEGVDLGAAMADMKFGFTHLKDMRRIALVGDEKWTHRLASLPNPFSLEIKAFKEADEHEAWDWATGT